MRLEDYDYSQNGYYFFTICTQDKQRYFGQVRGSIMGLNTLGCVIWSQWYWLAQRYNYVKLGAFIVMPNHVHGILIIERPEGVGLELARGKSPLLVEGLPETGENDKILDLYRLIRAFKSRSSKIIHEAGYLSFAWQESFYEHVILQEKSLENIQYYILTNPDRWHQDRNYV